MSIGGSARCENPADRCKKPPLVFDRDDGSVVHVHCYWRDGHEGNCMTGRVVEGNCLGG